MVAVDTNVLVRLVTRDDPRQVKAAEEFIAGGAWVSVLALAETVWVLGTYYERDSKDISRMVEMLLDHPTLTLQDSDAVTAALTVFRSKPALGFSDCLLVELARKRGHVPFGTFDRKLGKIDRVQLL